MKHYGNYAVLFKTLCIISYGACGLPYFVSDVVKEHKELLSTPIGVIRDHIYIKIFPRDKEIITFCRFSLRGYEAQRILEANGFNKVKFMDGGLIAWPFETIGKIWH